MPLRPSDDAVMDQRIVEKGMIVFLDHEISDTEGHCTSSAK